MTLGATVVALVFHVVPGRAEPVGLLIATAFAIVAGVISLLRVSKAARPGEVGAA